MTIANLLQTLDCSDDAFFVFDEGWRYQYVNAAACAMLQRTRAELVGQNAWQLFPELRHTETAHILERIKREGQPAAWTYHSKFRNSWVECHAYPLPGGALGVTMHDVAARVRVERAHQESEQRFRALADLVPCMLWVADPSGRPSWVNRRWLDYSGMRVEELALGAIHPDDVERCIAEFRAAAAEKRLGLFEHRMRRHDGTYRWHLAQAQPIVDEGGNISYWLGTAVDIQTERETLASEKTVRRDAEQTRDHFHRVLAQAPLALAVFLGSDHTLEVSTRLAHELYGCKSYGQPARECLHDAAVARGMLDKLVETYTTGKPVQVCGEHDNDRIVDTHYSALTRASGEVYGVLVASIDVTVETRARQHAEQERLRLARAVEQAPFSVAITSGPEHVLRSANVLQMRLFGHRATLNLSARAAFPEPELEPVHALFDRAFHQNETVILREQRIGWDRTGAGETQYGYFDMIYQPITDENGRVEGLLCVSSEVTESVEARQALKLARDQAEQARDRLDQIMAAIPTAIAVTRGQTHVYDLVNAAYTSMIGSRDVLGCAVRELYPEVKDNGFQAVLDRVYHQGERAELPERRVLYDKYNDGTEYEGYFSSFFAPLKTRDGEITGVVASAIEVTDQVLQRQYNEALRGEAEAAKDALERAHTQLELRIAERTAELKHSNEALAEEIATRNHLQRRLSGAREDEQRRAARDLHDQLGQTLSALTLTIKAACEAATLPAATLSRLEEALRLADILGRDMHDLATRLRPAVLDEFGLHAALRQLCADWSRHRGIAVDFEAAWLKNKRFPADIETTLYRVTQEALTNIARHAQATHVSVVVELNDSTVIAIIEDDGRGFDVATLEPGRMGLAGMRERVMLVGGTFDIEATPGAGTTVFVSIPVGEGA